MLRVAALVDLPRSPSSGGHVKGWEKRALSVANSELPIDLTVYFSGPEREEQISEHVRFRSLPPIFSTEKFKFLYFPDHTDLASHHPKLARELSSFDVLHTTDAFFNFARTAARVSQAHNIPLVTSMHTATPAYTYIFTRKTIEQLAGKGWFGRIFTERLDIPGGQERKMDRRLKHHLQLCRHALVQRHEDRALAESVLGPDRVHDIHTCVDPNLFGIHRRDRAKIEEQYKIPSNRTVILFVGRMDVGKNIYTLIEAVESLIKNGVPVHLITAGLGPATEDVRTRLGSNATIAGYVNQDNLAQLYASVDCLALVSEIEIRSFVGVEALASGCPVLVSEKSNIAAVFQQTPAMRVVSGKGKEWAAALKHLADDRLGQQTMRAAALDYAHKNFMSWEQQMQNDFIRVWQSA